MHILYIDESGTHSDARHFVVAGVAVYETDAYFLAQDFDGLQARYLPERREATAFHVSALRAASGRDDPYPELPPPERRALIADVYTTIASSPVRIFAVAMEKSFVIGDCYERGFEEIVNRFDRMLGRISRTGPPQRGLIVAAESSYRENLEVLARRIARDGHRWGRTHHIADIPYFAPAAHTRLLQAADFVANAVYGRYESGYTGNFDTLAARIDQDEGTLHGLVHLNRQHGACYCPACMSRRLQPRPTAGALLLPEDEAAGG